MSRFRKGTMDHDGDGRRGGSMKGNDMARKSTKRAAAKPVAREAGDMDPQSGMVAGRPPEEAKKAAADKFAEADAKAEPSNDELDALRVGQQVRGY